MNDNMNLFPNKFYLDDIFNGVLVQDRNNMKCDIYEKDNKYYIEMDVPGFKKEDIKIAVNNDYLTITAVQDSKITEDKEKKYIKRERIYNKYQRSFYVGKINENDINARFNYGTLIVNFPKEIEKNNQKFIEIE